LDKKHPGYKSLMGLGSNKKKKQKKQKVEEVHAANSTPPTKKSKKEKKEDESRRVRFGENIAKGMSFGRRR
jgi:hypothetical protein